MKENLVVREKIFMTSSRRPRTCDEHRKLSDQLVAAVVDVWTCLDLVSLFSARSGEDTSKLAVWTQRTFTGFGVHEERSTCPVARTCLLACSDSRASFSEALVKPRRIEKKTDPCFCLGQEISLISSYEVTDSGFFFYVY